MSKPFELSFEQLQNRCDESILPFKTTAGIDTFDGIIGQDRAVNSMKFGLKMKVRGYNIYMAGPTGTGKTSFAKQLVNEIAQTKPVPDDWCYIYNFSKPNQPMAINLPAGMGKIFQQDMEQFVKTIKQEINKAFDNEDYEKEKSQILEEFNNKKEELLEQLSKDAEKQGFQVKTGNSGIYFLPIIEGRTLNEEEYSELDDETKSLISERTNVLQLDTLDIIRKLKNNDKQAEEKVLEWENKIALLAIGVHIDDLKEKYKKYALTEYFEKI